MAVRVSTMKRRHFLQAAASSLVIPRAMALVNTHAPAVEQPGQDYFFYDERFAQARRLAEELSGSTALTPVQGDITGFWNSGLDRATRQFSVMMRGVTTESFYFCLKIMAGEQADLDAQVTRLDRDLFLWTIRTCT
jgi:hypothetical protein